MLRTGQVTQSERGGSKRRTGRYYLGIAAAWLVIALIFISPILDSISALSPPQPQSTVKDFVDAFNDGEFGDVCELLTPRTRRAFERAYEPVTLDAGESVDEYARELERELALPTGDRCAAGAESVHDKSGRISSGPVTRTIRETDRLAYAMTNRGRWKLTWNGKSWQLAGHPPLETLSGSASDTRP